LVSDLLIFRFRVINNQQHQYGWVPPNYWYSRTNTRDVGSAFGFATEISPGAAPLTLDSMQKTMPPSSIWDNGE
jgi:exo-1,4-beta-D-glucosaminidase